MMNYEHRINMTVRLHECDMGCVVNNAVYLQYLEHSKCEWLKSINITYGDLVIKKQSFIVSKLNIDFKSSLTYDDNFWVCVNNVRRPSDYHLDGEQNIFRSDGKTILLSSVVVVFMQDQKMHKLPQAIIDKYPLTNNAVPPIQNK